ncbi:MAG: hypothetical protein M5U28_40270 [Sandaracinaceae bacterium]|nr:hypothetical protein [Sandaracinaceae bacterium]
MAPLAFRDLLLEHVGFVGDGHVGLWVFDPRRRWRATSEHRQAYAAPAARFTRSDGGFVHASGRRLARCDERPAAEVLRPVPGAALPALEYVPLVLSVTPRGSIECAYEDGAIESFPLARVDLEGRRGPPSSASRRPSRGCACARSSRIGAPTSSASWPAPRTCATRP